jgi:hypothetical protein
MNGATNRCEYSRAIRPRMELIASGMIVTPSVRM